MLYGKILEYSNVLSIKIYICFYNCANSQEYKSIADSIFRPIPHIDVLLNQPRSRFVFRLEKCRLKA